MFHTIFSQSGMRLREIVTDDLAEAHAWIDERFAQFGWGGACIKLHGVTFSTRSITEHAYKARQHAAFAVVA